MTLTITWPMVAFMVSMIIGGAGFLLGIIKWLLNREINALAESIKGTGAAAKKAGEDLAVHKTEYLRFLAELPLNYYRKEDWIRFETTMHMKLDAVAREIKSLECRKCQSST